MRENTHARPLYATNEPRSGAKIPLMFTTAVARDAFLATHTGAKVLAEECPWGAVSNVRTPEQLKAASR